MSDYSYRVATDIIQKYITMNENIHSISVSKIKDSITMIFFSSFLVHTYTVYKREDNVAQRE